MNIQKAVINEIKEISALDLHIPVSCLADCIENGKVYVLKDGDGICGVLRYSLFWQTIPFLDLIYLARKYRDGGYGTEMMRIWENDMRKDGYKYVMTSTQADETAWRFYEKLGYGRAGGFFPPEQEAEELIYVKRI